MSRHYQPCKLLVIFGLGGRDRLPYAKEHMAAGKPVISWDIGYWERHVRRRKYRVSVNGFHPKQVLEGRSPTGDRFYSGGQGISTIKANPASPILLIGNAPKSQAVGAKGWTEKASKALREKFPKRKILYRPKPRRPKEPGVEFDRLSVGGTIEGILKNVSLVYCRHSNVAVDACKLGIPVVCEDGAASLIYPNRLDDYKSQPNEETRKDFLFRLAYWQWGELEVDEFWHWFFDTFPSYDYRRISEPRRIDRDQRRVARI